VAAGGGRRLPRQAGDQDAAGLTDAAVAWLVALSAPSPSLRRALAGFAVAGFVACAVLLALAIDSVGGHHRDLIAIFGPLIGGAFIGTGLLAWLRRPENRFGALMVALGFAYCLSGLIVTTDSWPFIAGLALIAVPYAILFHILLAFPSGRLETRANRLLAAAAYVTATLAWWGCMLIQDTTRIGVPANPLLVADEPDLFSTLAKLRLGVVAALIVLLGVVLARRWRASTRSQRRALAPVYVTGGLVLALYAVWAVLGVVDASADVQETLERARVIALATVPFAFLAGLLRSRVAGAAALSELIARLGEGRRKGALRDALADAIGDPRLELAYWVREREEWVDAAGAPFALPAGRAQTPVEHDGHRVALLVHDATAPEERELMQAVGAAAALALENERLDAELLASVKELRASRARIVESGDAARRRIERDLHDGAQQQLVALALTLRMARARVEQDPQLAAELLDAMAGDLDAAIRELRELARGIHPAVLSDRGLGSALEALAARIPLPVEIVAIPDERLPPPVEAAAYFVVAEAITNVARYAQASHARVEVARDGERVVVRVADDGIGGADPGKGSGLRGLADRVAALDGRLEVRSEPGRGTTVQAIIPCPSPAPPTASRFAREPEASSR
jgi:signal transduction histidine kinase